MIVLDEENPIIEISVQAAIQFAQRDAVRVNNEDFQIAKLTDTDDTFLIPFRLWDKSFQGDRLDMDLHFPGNLHNGSVQRVQVNIVANEVNVNRQARTSEQCQRTPPTRINCESGGRRAPRFCRMVMISALSTNYPFRNSSPLRQTCSACW